MSAVLEPSGNNGIDQGVFINEIEGNQFLEKAGKYDNLIVAARSH